MGEDAKREKQVRSEVARIRHQITRELESMQHGFRGFTVGTARHEFIHAKMQQLADHQDQLSKLVGTHDATTIVCELYINIINV